jgi:ketosteroid isomerase-like protein
MVTVEKVEVGNVQILSTAYMAFVRGDIPAVLSALAADIDWVMAWRFRDGKAVAFLEFTDTPTLASAFR